MVLLFLLFVLVEKRLTFFTFFFIPNFFVIIYLHLLEALMVISNVFLLILYNAGICNSGHIVNATCFCKQRMFTVAWVVRMYFDGWYLVS